MKLQTLISLHRILGIIVTFFVIVLCLTGILLLHTEDLRLQETFTDSDLLLDWYGIAPQNPPRSYQLDNSWVTQVDAKVYLDTVPLPENNEVLQGAVNLGGFIVVAFESSIYLLTREGDLVERLDSLQGVPAGIESIASIPLDNIALQTRDGVLTSGIDMVSWKPQQELNAAWTKSVEPPPELLDQLLQNYRGEGLPLERVITDLHSGRILGTFGVLIVDAIVILLLVLTVSGWWNWLRRRAIQKELEMEE